MTDEVLKGAHHWNSMTRPRECTVCGFVQHDGSGIGYQSYSQPVETGGVQLEVIQSDRDAAAPMCSGGLEVAVQKGHCDGLQIVQAFAAYRQRLTAQAKPSASVGKMALALRKIAEAQVAFDAHPVGVIETMRQWARDALPASGLTASEEWEGDLTSEDQAMIDGAWEKHKAAGPCDRPPEGWSCSRAHGHDGPCAADATCLTDRHDSPR